MPGDRPNILLILSHDTGRRLGCYGAGVATPHLDALAASGVRLLRCHCTAPQCSPSRGSLLTGRFPHRNGLMGLAHLGWRLGPGERPLPRLLGAAGYDTFLAGLQHAAADPEHLGYRHVLETRRDARSVGGAVCRFLRHRPADAGPFLLVAGLRETHRPFEGPDCVADDPRHVSVPAYLPDLGAVREDLAAFGGAVRAADAGVGKMLRALDASGLAAHTLVVFTTDHGVAFPRAKGMCYDAGLETAMLLRWPGRIAAGTVCGRLLSNVDLLPTLLEAAGAPPAPGIDGRSFLPTLLSRHCAPREPIFFESTWHDRYNPVRGIRTDRHKYLLNFDPESPLVYLPGDVYRSPSGLVTREHHCARPRPAEELYDLDADPAERHNLAADAAAAATVAELRAALDAWMRRTGDPLLQGPVVPPRAQAERLVAEAEGDRLTGPLTATERALIAAALR